MSRFRHIVTFTLAPALAGWLAMGCKGESPNRRGGSGGGAGLVDTGALPAYLHNLADISFIADPGRKQVVIAAPAGSVTSQALDARVTAWEIAADVTATKYHVDGDLILLPAKLRGQTKRGPDGAFNFEITYAGAGAVLISTDADPNAGVVILRKDAPGVSAGLKNPFDEAPLKPLSYADFTGTTGGGETARETGTSTGTAGGWDG